MRSNVLNVFIRVNSFQMAHVEVGISAQRYLIRERAVESANEKGTRAEVCLLVRIA